MQNKKKSGSVCFLTYDLAFGGTEKVIVTIANELSLSGRDISIAMLGKRNDFKNIINPKIKIIFLNCENIRSSPFKLFSFFKKYSFDNLVANLWPITSLSFLVKLTSLHTNLIIIEHCPLSMQFKERGFYFRKFLKLSIKAFYGFADTIVAVSFGVKEDLLSLGCPKNKIRVIYNPFHKNSLDANKNYDTKILKWIKSSKINLISVGELKESKNFLNLVKSMDILKRRYKQKINLLILGDGNERSKIQEHIKECNMEDHIFLPGWVADPIIYMELSDLFVLSSDYEGFGVVIIEAFSVGLNVVSTNSVGPAEILKNGELGVLCQINDPISMAESIMLGLKSPFPKKVLLSRAAEFAPKIIAQEYEKILK